MLGRTNLNVLPEGGTATEVEDYRWIQVQAGVFGDFVKAVYKGGYLAAITADGSVVSTVDGEVWDVLVLGYGDCRLNDIDWDGNRFLLAGSYMDESISTTVSTGLLVATADFKAMEKLEPLRYSNNECYEEYYAVMPRNGKYNLIAKRGTTAYALYTDLTEVDFSQYMTAAPDTRLVGCSIAKNSNGLLAAVHEYYRSYYHGIYNICGDNVSGVNGTIHNCSVLKAMNVFECKDNLYFMNLLSGNNYNLNKVTASSEVMVMATGQDFGFVDGTYFDGCEIFINSHGALVIRKGESIADKAVGDMIEIAPEMTMSCIVRAFGQLYIFGNHGIILKSSVETGNEAGIAVQTISAKKALADAKAYADGLYRELEARIAALEAGG